MMIHPKRAIEEGWLKGIADPEKQLQPNAIDITVDQMFHPNQNDVFELTENTKVHRSSRELLVDDQEGWLLKPGMYDFLSEAYIEVPQGVAAWLVPRSSLIRNGNWAFSGIYDSGFKGHIGGAFHTPYGYSRLRKGTRIAQLILMQTEDIGIQYEGGYNHNRGTDWKDNL